MRNGFSQNRLSLTSCPKQTRKFTGVPAHQPDRTHLKPLTVGNFAGFTCVINEATGELVQSQFTK